MRSRSIQILLLVAALVGSISILNAQDRGVPGTLTADAPVMLLPEEGRTPLAVLTAGTRVQVIDAPEEGWYRISFQDNYLFGDRVGFVRAEHVRVFGRVPGVSPERSLTPGAGHKALPESNAPAATRQSKPAATQTRVSAPTPQNGSAPHTNGGSAAPPIEPKFEPAARIPRAGLSESSIATAIILGQRQRDGSDGLRLFETGVVWTRAGSKTSSAGSRFRLQIHTPLAWIQQQARDAARASRTFTLDDVTDEMTEPVLRVVAYSGTPASRGSWVRHIELRSTANNVVVQPLTKEAFSEHVLSAGGGSAVSEGMRVTFSMDAVRRLRGRTGDAEFFVSVTGPAGEKKDVRLTRSHLAALPM